MIQPIGPILQAPREEVELGGVQIPGGGIHAQSVTISGRRNEFGRANRSAIEEQLRKECRAIASRGSPRESLQHVERWYSRAGWVRRQVEDWHALIVTERIGHVHPVKDMRRSPQGFNAVRRRFVIFAPSHGCI